MILSCYMFFMEGVSLNRDRNVPEGGALVAEKDKKTKLKVVERKVNARVYFKRYWQLYALLALPLIYLFVFKYIPMI